MRSFKELTIKQKDIVINYIDNIYKPVLKTTLRVTSLLFAYIILAFIIGIVSYGVDVSVDSTTHLVLTMVCSIIFALLMIIILACTFEAVNYSLAILFSHKFRKSKIDYMFFIKYNRKGDKYYMPYLKDYDKNFNIEWNYVNSHNPVDWHLENIIKNMENSLYEFNKKNKNRDEYKKIY